MKLLRVLVMLLMYFGAAETMTARAGDQQEVHDQIRLRRIFTPVDRMDRWPPTRQRYLPIDQDEFQRLTNVINTNVNGPASARGRLERATYSARLDGNDLVRGVAKLDIKFSSENEEAFVLAGIGIPVSNPRWATRDSSAARVALQEEDQLVVLMDRPGQLDFDWSLKGTRDALDVITFRLRIPRCLSTHVSLQLPANKVPTVNHGLVKSPVDSGFSDRQPTGVHQTDEPARRFHEWTLLLGGHTDVTLQIFPENVYQIRRRLVLVRQSATYEVAEQGIDLSVKLNLDVHYQPLRKIAVDLDPQLQLTAARIDDRQLAWSMEPVSESQPRRATLEFAEPLMGMRRVIQLRAIAPLHESLHQQLPRISSRDMLWQEGTATITIVEPLSLVGIHTDGCQPTSFLQHELTQGSESFELQSYRQNARIDIALAQHGSRVAMHGGTSVRLGKAFVETRFVGDFRSLEGHRFDLTADVPADWIIDTVESDPADLVADWNVEYPSTQRQQLRIRLKESLSPERQLRLFLTGRLPRSMSDEALGMEAIHFARFRDIEVAEHFMAIQAEALQILEPNGDSDLTRLQSDQLTDEQKERVDVDGSDLLFAFGDGAHRLTFSLSEQGPTFSADIAARATASEKMLSEFYAIHIQPKSTYVDRLLVRFSEVREVEPSWTLVDDPGGGLEKTRLPQASAAIDGAFPNDELWELRLRQPRLAPFEIRAVRSSQFHPPVPISLMSVVNASEQIGTLTIRTDASTSPEIHNKRLHRIPSTNFEFNEFSTTRAVYRYDPSRDTLATSSKAVIISAVTSEDHQHRAWVTSRIIESKYSTSGLSRHRITHRLENSAASEIHITPHDASLFRRILVDSKEVLCEPSSKDNGAITVPLPQGERFPVVVVEVEANAKALGLVGVLSAPLPRIDVPCLGSRWSINVPFGYTTTSKQESTAHDRPRWNWRQRMFGTFGRNTRSSPFHPFWLARWQHSFERDFKSQHFVDADNFRQPSEVELAFSFDTIPVVSVFHHQFLQALGWTVLLSVSALVWWFARQSLFRWFLVAVVAAIVALLAPTMLVPITSRLLLGVIIGGLLVVLPSMRENRRLMARVTRSDSSSIKQVLIRTSVVFMAAGTITTCLAQELETDAPAEKKVAPILPMIVPIDSDGLPTTDHYYIPEEAYHSLYSWAAALDHRPRGWLIYSARYEMTFDWEIPHRRLEIFDFHAIFDLTSISHNVSMRLPFRRDQVTLAADAVTLDGRVLPFVWSERGDSLEFHIDEPGQFLLKISMQPKKKRLELIEPWTLTIPPVAQSKLEIKFPTNAPALEIPSSRGIVDFDREHGKVRADLGPTDLLSIRRAKGSGHDANTIQTDVEELLWLKVRPGSVVLDARFTFRMAGGRLQLLQLLTDSRLRLLPLENPSMFRREPVVAEQLEMISFELKEPADGQVTVKTSFLVTDTSGIGNLLVPKLQAVGNITRRWLTISVAPELELQEHNSEELRRIAVPEFKRAWGKTSDEPLHVYNDLVATNNPLTFSTQPREPVLVANQRLEIVCHQDRADVRFHADVVTENGTTFQHVLLVPAELEVKEILWGDEKNWLVARWSRVDEDHINVFVDHAVKANYRISFKGHILVDNANKFSLPYARLMNAKIQSDTIRLDRMSGVSVVVGPTHGLTAREVPAAESTEFDEARFVAAWDVTESLPHVGAQITADVPSVDAVQISSLRYQDGGWLLDVDYEASVSSGILDRVRFDLPETCGSAITIQPKLPYRVSALAGTKRQRLEIALPESVANTHRFQLRIPITFPPGKRPHVPHVVPIDQPERSQFVLVPDQVQSQSVLWDTPLLHTSQLPDHWRLSGPTTEGYVVYRAVDSDYHAELTPTQETIGVPAVCLVNTVISWQAGHTFHATASYDLDPAGLEHCHLCLPASTKLVHVSVGGLPAQIDRVTETSWSVALNSARLPQRIEIVYVGNLARRGWTRQLIEFSAPTLANVPVQRSLWSMDTSSFVSRGITLERTHGISREAQLLLRLRTITECMELPAHIVAEEMAEDISRWYRRWAQRYVAAHKALTDPQANVSVSGIVDSTDVTALDKRQQAIATKLGTQAEWEKVWSHSDRYVKWNQRSDEATFQNNDITRLLFHEDKNTIEVVFHDRPMKSRYGHFFAAFILTVALAWAMRNRSTCENRVLSWFVRWPHFTGVLIGIAWWLWLVPSFLGWMIIIASLLCAVGLPRTLNAFNRPGFRVILSRRS